MPCSIVISDTMIDYENPGTAEPCVLESGYPKSITGMRFVAASGDYI